MHKFKRYLLVAILVVLVFIHRMLPQDLLFVSDDYTTLVNDHVITSSRLVSLPKFKAMELGSNEISLYVSSSTFYNSYIVFRVALTEQLVDNDQVLVDIVNRDNKMQKLQFKYVLNKDRKPDTKVIRSIQILNPQYAADDSRPFWNYIRVGSCAVTFFQISSRNADKHLGELKLINGFKLNNKIHTDGGSFKIFQISDLHYLDGDHHVDQYLIDAISKENPQLIVLNGDIVEFSHKFGPRDQFSILLNAFNLFIDRRIPYVVNFGELEHRHNPRAVLEIVSLLPYSLNTVVPSEHGLTNYNFQIIRKNKLLGVISLLDSEDNSLTNSQINLVYRFNSNLKGNVYRLGFFHYPLPNFRPVGKFKIVGEYNYKEPLDTKTDPTFLDDFVSLGFHVLSASHEHDNNACLLVDQIFFCFSSIAGGAGTQTGDRNIRVFELGDRLLSWKFSEQMGKGYEYQLIHEFA